MERAFNVKTVGRKRRDAEDAGSCGTSARLRVSALKSICVILVALAIHEASGAEQYDFSSPTSTFRSLGLAIKNNDPKAFLNMFVSLGQAPYDLLLKEYWEGTGGHMPRFGLNSETLAGATPARVAQFFCEAVVLKESADQSEEVEGRLHHVLLVRWTDGKIIRKERFIRFPKETAWKWLPLFEHDRKVYDFSTPANTYLALAQSLRYKLVREVVTTCATSVKGGLSDKEWQGILEERLSRMKKREREETWNTPELSGLRDAIEEEMTPPSATLEPTKCKVWDLTDARKREDRKRVDFETFVKEGNEWKWLPKPKYFWYPTKTEPKR